MFWVGAAEIKKGGRKEAKEKQKCHSECFHKLKRAGGLADWRIGRVSCRRIVRIVRISWGESAELLSAFEERKV